ncbi:MAG: hypothetical protein KAR19_08615 [Bacteroidales bacterium]|nr:hypothetical protein [Bacteroidales bacterium]
MDIKEFSSHIFWSYDRFSDLKPEVVIKQVIVYGEVKDMILLVKKVGEKRIYEVIKNWKDQEKYDKHINFMEKVILG